MPAEIIVLQKYDLDLLTNFGFYSVNDPIHAPKENMQWCNVIVLQAGGNSDYPMQILIQHTIGNIPYINIRFAVNKSYGDWYTFASTNTE